MCVLPGEVEEDLPAHTPVFCHRTQLELSCTDMDYRGHTPPSNTDSQVYKQLITYDSLNPYVPLELLTFRVTHSHINLIIGFHQIVSSTEVKWQFN